MISVDDARALILETVAETAAEEISIDGAEGRILAEDAHARLTQPPFNASAMDGYAVKFDDMAEDAVLTVVGEAAAGAPSNHVVRSGEAIRIFTGGVVPDGADHVVIQEDVVRDDDRIRIVASQDTPAHIRRAGRDFQVGDLIAAKGVKLSPVALGLIAAANVARIPVRRRPVVAFFDNGDELVEPGAALRSGQIIGANRFALAALIRAWGGEPRYLGRAPDDLGGVRQKFEAASDVEILVAIGGASVGDHDYVRPAFDAAGGKLVFSKIAVKPGKPTWFGRLGTARVLGLPGNPASAIVCAALFLRPLIEKLLGTDEAVTRSAIASIALPANGPRETYLRARFVGAENGLRRIAPFDDQDSSLLAPLAAADALIRRPANAPVVGAGDELEIVRLL